MEKKNKNLLIFIGGLLILIIGIASIIKVYTNHIDSLYMVVEKKISETAKDCFLEGICEGDETTLGFLIRNGYLSTQINPVTKETISENLFIIFKNGRCSVNIR